MITRRHALKIAASLAAARAAGPSIEPAEAARLLDLPASETPGRLRSDGLSPADILSEPMAFADQVRGDLDDGLFAELIDFVAPTEYAEYQHAKAALRQAIDPAGNVPFGHPFHHVDEATLAWAFASYAEGVAHGAAYENLRLALVGRRTRVCHRCDGRGLVGDGGRWWHTGPSHTCPDCQGRGVISTG